MLSVASSRNVSFRRKGAQLLGGSPAASPRSRQRLVATKKDEVYNPQHINSLPPDVRAFVYAMCNEPRALHTFAEQAPPLDPDVADTAPTVSALTPYDHEHLITYLRLLDADADGADWHEVASIVLHIDWSESPIAPGGRSRATSRERSG